MNVTEMKTIYLDNGATSFPKPACVAESINNYICNVGATINRSVYKSASDAGLVTYALRERLCRLFNFDDPRHVVLTAGNTMAMNMIIKGFLKPGDHVIVSSMEHNAVMRPLVQLEAKGISFDRIPSDKDGIAKIDEIPCLFKENTKLVIVNHASNVGGGLQDIVAIGRICEEKGVPFVVDGAQSAGHYPLDFKAAKLSALTVPAHKGLLGPQGIGALLMTPEFASKVDPLVTGGTGSASDSEIQPDYMPDRFESGTSNMPGIYGFEASTRFIEETGIDAIRRHEIALTARFIEGLDKIPGLRIVGPKSLENRVGVVSVDCLEEDNAEVAYALETEYGILTRCGLHCAPSAHKTLGTFPQGVIRFSLSWFNTEEDVDAAIGALIELLS